MLQTLSQPNNTFMISDQMPMKVGQLEKTGVHFILYPNGRGDSNQGQTPLNQCTVIKPMMLSLIHI